MLQRLIDTFGEDKENAIKLILHQEYNKGGNRYKDLTVSSAHVDVEKTVTCLYHFFVVRLL